MNYKIYNMDVMEGLKQIPDKSVNCVISSPPYWQLRDYGFAGQWGLEPTFTEYLEHLWSMMDEINRVLTDDGTVWINLGDTYNTISGNMKSKTFIKTINSSMNGGRINPDSYTKANDVKEKCLLMIPQRFAIGCIERGWIVRNEIIWAKCLSGGTRLYAKTNKGIFPQTIKDLKRLKDVELWTGSKWSKVVKFYENTNVSNPLEIVLRSGEKIACTREHRFPVGDKLVQAQDLKIGDILKQTVLPPQKEKHDIFDDYLIAWFVGLYIAEGSRSDKMVQISSHKKESERLGRLTKLAKMFDGACNFYETSDNGMTINLSGIMFHTVIDKFVAGHTAKDKHLTTDAWQRDNTWLNNMLMSYLDGDSNYDVANNRYRLGFTDNVYWVNDLRTICARLNCQLRVKRNISKIGEKEFKGYRGEIRFEKSNHLNNKKDSEIVAIRNSNGRKFWDIEIEDEPHLFALASGILTHNSNGMPESVTDRFTKKHEQIYFMVKNKKYYFDLDAVRVIPKTGLNRMDKPNERILLSGIKSNSMEVGIGNNPNGANPGDVVNFWESEKPQYSVADRKFRNLVVTYRDLPDKIELADYLNNARKRMNYTIEDVENFFGGMRSHHWFEKSDSFSFPSVEDWNDLKIILNLDDKFDKEMTTEYEKSGLKQDNPNGANPGDTWFINTRPSSEKHYAMFNNELIKKPILAGCPKGGVVLDMFMGSGTTGVTALHYGRKFIGIEANTAYFNIAKSYLEIEDGKLTLF